MWLSKATPNKSIKRARLPVTSFAVAKGAPVTVRGAGRTDAGVHALGQVASCALDTRLSGWRETGSDSQSEADKRQMAG